jgi:hypothetical protein
MRSYAGQRGWVGLLVVLLALVIVGLLAKTALKAYGVLDEPKTSQVNPGATETEQAAAITPRNALERAKGVQDMVNQGTIEQQKRIDDAIPK